MTYILSSGKFLSLYFDSWKISQMANFPPGQYFYGRTLNSDICIKRLSKLITTKKQSADSVTTVSFWKKTVRSHTCYCYKTYILNCWNTKVQWIIPSANPTTVLSEPQTRFRPPSCGPRARVGTLRPAISLLVLNPWKINKEICKHLKYNLSDNQISLHTSCLF